MHRILLQLQQVLFSCRDFEYIFLYSCDSRRHYTNFHFLPVESVSSICGIVPEDGIILIFFGFLFPEIGLCDLILLQLVAF